MLNMRESWTDERLDDFLEEILMFLSLMSTTLAGYAAMIALVITRT